MNLTCQPCAVLPTPMRPAEQAVGGAAPPRATGHPGRLPRPCLAAALAVSVAWLLAGPAQVHAQTPTPTQPAGAAPAVAKAAAAPPSRTPTGPAAAPLAPRAAQAPAGPAALPLRPVPAAPAATGAAMVAIPDPASRQKVVRGVVRAVGEATLSSRLAARINRLPLGEGEAFRRGDVLVAFDCERPQAEARAASAAVEAQRKTVETNEELDKFNAIGKNDLLVSRAQLDRVRAESDALDSQVRECAVLAPFDGRVMARLARAHESVQMGQPLLKVADTSDLELELIVPSPWLSWLKLGTPFQFRVDETGRVLQAQLSRVGAAVDPISRTVRVMGRFAKSDAAVLPGMSGTGSFAGRGRSSP